MQKLGGEGGSSKTKAEQCEAKVKSAPPPLMSAICLPLLVILWLVGEFMIMLVVLIVEDIWWATAAV